MMWQVPITVLYGEELNQVPIRHDKEIDEVELLLVFVGRSHYLGTCKYIFIYSFVRGTVCSMRGLPRSVRGSVFLV